MVLSALRRLCWAALAVSLTLTHLQCAVPLPGLSGRCPLLAPANKMFTPSNARVLLTGVIQTSSRPRPPF